MGFSSLQVCMDSSQWLQGTIQEMGMDSSSPSGSTDPMLASSRPSMEKKLRPHHEQGLHCPRCDSTHTKFCYYNNYSLSQPRYFCKSCRRYWTKGGTLRNIPVGGVCRKNKKLSSNSKKFTTSSTTDDNNVSHNHHRQQQQQRSSEVISRNSTGLQLSYPESSMQFSGFPNFMFENLTSSATSAIDFMEGGSGEYEAADHTQAMVATGGYGSDTGNTHELTPFGYIDRGMMAYDHEHYDNTMNAVDVMPRLFALQRQNATGCHSDLHGLDAGQNGSSMYLMGIGPSWTGSMDGYGSSATDPLV